MEEGEIRGLAEARGAHSGRTPSSEETRSHSRSPTCGASEREVRLGAGFPSRQDDAGSRAEGCPGSGCPPLSPEAQRLADLERMTQNRHDLKSSPWILRFPQASRGGKELKGERDPVWCQLREATCELSPNPSCPPREAWEGEKVWEREVKAGKLTGWSRRELAPRVLSHK